jgi:hypothetical protein
VGYVLTTQCAGTVGCSCYIFELNHSINSKRQFLSCARLAFDERYLQPSTKPFAGEAKLYHAVVQYILALVNVV